MEPDRKGFRSIWCLLLGFCLLAAMVLALCFWSSMKRPDNVGRKLTDEERAEVAARNSPLIDYIFLSPNADFPRGDSIKKLTIHHMAGDFGLEMIGGEFFPAGQAGFLQLRHRQQRADRPLRGGKQPGLDFQQQGK